MSGIGTRLPCAAARRWTAFDTVRLESGPRTEPAAYGRRPRRRRPRRLRVAHLVRRHPADRDRTRGRPAPRHRGNAAAALELPGALRLRRQRACASSPTCSAWAASGSSSGPGVYSPPFPQRARCSCPRGASARRRDGRFARGHRRADGGGGVSRPRRRSSPTTCRRAGRWRSTSGRPSPRSGPTGAPIFYREERRPRDARATTEARTSPPRWPRPTCAPRRRAPSIRASSACTAPGTRSRLEFADAARPRPGPPGAGDRRLGRVSLRADGVRGLAGGRALRGADARSAGPPRPLARHRTRVRLPCRHAATHGPAARRPAAGTRALRLRTTQEIYWDRVERGRTPNRRRRSSTRRLLPLGGRALASGGFATRTDRARSGRRDYDYARRVPLLGHPPPARLVHALRRRSTRSSASADDAVAIFGPGEEVLLEFDAPPAALPPGWTRRVVLETPTAGARTWTSTPRTARP